MKRDDDGDVVDEIAVKVTKVTDPTRGHKAPNAWFSDDEQRLLTTEAVMHRQVNSMESESKSSAVRYHTCHTDSI